MQIKLPNIYDVCFDSYFEKQMMSNSNSQQQSRPTQSLFSLSSMKKQTNPDVDQLGAEVMANKEQKRHSFPSHKQGAVGESPGAPHKVEPLPIKRKQICQCFCMGCSQPCSIELVDASGIGTAMSSKTGGHAGVDAQHESGAFTSVLLEHINEKK